MMQKVQPEFVERPSAWEVNPVCLQADYLVDAVVEKAQDLTLLSYEPGVELINALEPLIHSVIAEAVNQPCDLSEVIKGIILGAFRSRDSVREEAHKTIDHLVRLILKQGVQLQADVSQVMAGLIQGVMLAAREADLHAEVAVAEAAASAVRFGVTLGANYAKDIRAALPAGVQAFSYNI